MKYRGIFSLQKRIETAEGYNLGYSAHMGQWTIKEGMRTWIQKSQKSIPMM